MSILTDTIRKQFKEGDDIRDEGLTTPDTVQRFDNILYGDDPEWNTMDLYIPKEEKEKLPIIISFHGGGWVYGDKERYQYYCMSLAERGFAVINFTYRLAPEFKHPAPLEDMNQVAHWIMNHAKDYFLDTEHIYGVGDSAGAHLLVLYTSILTNKEYASTYDFKVPEGFQFNALALNCGAYNITPELELTRELMKEYLPNGGTEEEFKAIDPKQFITSDFPPCFVMTAEGDFLVEDALTMSQVLTHHNVPHMYRYYVGDKPLNHVFHCNIKLKEATQCNDEECQFFRNY